MIFVPSCLRAFVNFVEYAVGPFRNPFSSKTISFLRSLKRNNNREWFRARRDQYDAHVHEPMVATRVFYPTLVATFNALMPLVRFLNEPLLADRLPRP